MANLHFEVNTTPMAHSVDSVRGHVTGVTKAVTAMEIAVIATERKASKTICDNVDAGFYVLVKSQISQKAVAAYSEMQAKQIILIQLTKALEGVKRQMEADYNMVSRRYAKLFHSLNKALEVRIRELDRPAMKLAEIRKAFIFDKLKDESSLLLSSSSEITQVEQVALNGKLKQKTRETLKILSTSIYDSDSYNRKVDSILNKSSISSGIYYIPALFVAVESLLNQDDHVESVYATQSEVWQNTAPIVSEVNRISGDMKWGDTNGDNKALVRKEFLSLCEKEITGDVRLSQEIMRLFDQSVWEDFAQGVAQK
jgi:hypothetical protein